MLRWDIDVASDLRKSYIQIVLGKGALRIRRNRLDSHSTCHTIAFLRISLTGGLTGVAAAASPTASLIRLIKAFQFVEKYGEVCPANWKEGSKTMKADPKGSLEYFSAVNGANGTDGARKRARVD
ncbi:hypothetical protein NM688_g3880 [Phlebia brevispora]|uniref:Uncharacterized protein n=1 Tax=Phlebia brevispora TaxID=194682 RepID=A0ACC1T4P7_9APHY|nr:hypothetical protein NM688_g3880 [Phlebia brevispora]